MPDELLQHLAVRLTLAAWLAPTLGLQGVWIAMCVELCFRGFIFLVRLKRGRWLKHYPDSSRIPAIPND